MTSALRRVGITFTEAQEAAIKNGNEQERAAMLAQIITDNVGEMNKALAKTDAGKQKQLANVMGALKAKIGSLVSGSIKSYVTISRCYSRRILTSLKKSRTTFPISSGR